MLPRAISNIRPGRSVVGYLLRSLGNWARTEVYFTTRCRYARRSGMIRIPWSVSIWSPHRDVEFGDRVQFGPHCVVACDIAFGSSVLVARNVAFIGRDDHRHDVVGKTIWDSPRGDSHKTIVEDDVWIGHGAVVIAGVTIGCGSVVAAGSIVIEDVPKYSIVAGVPAKVRRMRFTQAQIQQHEKILRAAALS